MPSIDVAGRAIHVHEAGAGPPVVLVHSSGLGAHQWIRLTRRLSTRYRVLANGRAYWANCAWDAFGIPAMLDSDAQIHTSCANTDQPIAITIQRGQFEPKQGVVHFPLPFVRWYEDLVFT